VVKLAPDQAGPLLRYERGILATEAMYYQAAAGQAGVTVPSVIDVDAGSGVIPGGYLVMSECAGTPWHDLSPVLASQDRDELRAELGRQVAVLHTITGAGFGYPSSAVGPLRPTWRAAFLDMVGAVLADAARYAVALPRPAAEIRDLFQAMAPVLEQVQVPALVHFDLWDGNILVDTGGTAPRIGALIDAERAFWSDPLAVTGRRPSTGLFAAQLPPCRRSGFVLPRYVMVSRTTSAARWLNGGKVSRRQERERCEQPGSVEGVKTKGMANTDH
jgi:aminoglycoside phosphotransferase (APT) family kinase protein